MSETSTASTLCTVLTPTSDDSVLSLLPIISCSSLPPHISYTLSKYLLGPAELPERLAKQSASLSVAEAQTRMEHILRGFDLDMGDGEHTNGMSLVEEDGLAKELELMYAATVASPD